MKPGWILIGLVLLCQFACVHKEAGVLSSDERSITIAVSDDGSGGVKIEPPVPNDRIIKVNHRPRWIIVNNTLKDTIKLLRIYDFEQVTENKEKKTGICKEGIKEFKFTDIAYGDEQSPHQKCYVWDLPQNAPPEKYKYRVSVELVSGRSVEPLDPMIVITR